MQDYIARADYLVQLSDQEAYSYSVLEALINNTPVICTPVPSFAEQGVKDGVNGYVVPFDMDFDVYKLLDVPEFEYKYDNEKIIRQWKRLINAKPIKSIGKDLVQVVVTVPYTDIILKKDMEIGERLDMPRERAEYVQSLGFIKIV